MITKKGVFYLVCLLGYLYIVFKGIPVIYDKSVYHINLFPSGNSSDIYHEFIDYKKLTVYIVLWTVIIYILYKLSSEIGRKG